MKQDFDFSKEIPGITAPTLVVAGDADSFPPAHAVETFGLLGGGKRDGGWDGSGRPKSRLAILPSVMATMRSSDQPAIRYSLWTRPLAYCRVPTCFRMMSCGTGPKSGIPVPRSTGTRVMMRRWMRPAWRNR